MASSINPETGWKNVRNDMEYDIKTAIAIFVFNRPDQTERLMSVLRKVKPSKLFVVADGPRLGNHEDPSRCKRTREIVTAVDWECNVQYDFSEINLGCRCRVITGIDWVFKNTDSAVILEDDCIPHESFFRFCDEMLDRYLDDDRIMSVTGFNPRKASYGDASYFFSKYPMIWGWATWKRAWSHFADISCFNSIEELRQIEGALVSEEERFYWMEAMTRTYTRDIDTWCYSWFFACLKRHGLSIAPNSNLVINVGIGEDSTHSKACSVTESVRHAAINFPVVHPLIVSADPKADVELFMDFFPGRFIFLDRRIFKRATRFLKRRAGSARELFRSFVAKWL